MKTLSISLSAVFAATLSVAIFIMSSTYVPAAEVERAKSSGYKIISKAGSSIKIILDKELVSGTDSACERVEEIIQTLVKKGYHVRIANEGWIPTIDMAALEHRLDKSAAR